jgi:Zn-dependent metalloprotease
MKDYVNTPSDNGGVHINSGIPNRAFYVTATQLGGKAWEKAGQIWYVTLRDKLTSSSNFQTCANQTFTVAGALFGSGSLEQQAVKLGWSEVGIDVEGSGDSTPPTTSPGCFGSMLKLIGAA